jgi:ubiquinone biosynthesis protein UbiJ
MFTSPALDGIEIILNRALNYDPSAKNQLNDLRGQVLIIESTSPVFTLAIKISDTGLAFHDNWSEDAAVKISGTLIAMIGVALEDNSTSFSGTEVTVSGNLDTLNKVNSIMRDLDVDWEAALAELIGDLPAHILGRTIRSTRRAKSELFNRASSGLVDVAQEEFKLLPTTNEFEMVGPKIRKLSSDVDRLSIKIERLKDKIESPSQETLIS